MEQYLHYFQQIDPSWAYLLLFVSAFVENIFPPIPGDTVTVIGAYLVGRNLLNFWGVLISTTLGSILGFMGIFSLAYWLGWQFFERFHPRWAKSKQMERAQKWIHKYGYGVILLNRFLSGARSVISLVAGLSRMKVFGVFILALISCIIWNATLIYAGTVVGENWEKIVFFLQLYNRIIIVTLIVLTALIGFYWFFRKSRRKA